MLNEPQQFSFYTCFRYCEILDIVNRSSFIKLINGPKIRNTNDKWTVHFKPKIEQKCLSDTHINYSQNNPKNIPEF